MHICNVRWQVFFPGVWVCLRDFRFFLFFCSLERDPSLWENTWPWEILRIWESFPGIRLGNQDLWGGEKESTFDTGRRVETGTYHWEGRKPFIQTFDVSFRIRGLSFRIRAFSFRIRVSIVSESVFFVSESQFPNPRLRQFPNLRF